MTSTTLLSELRTAGARRDPSNDDDDDDDDKKETGTAAWFHTNNMIDIFSN
jgi:hypothetical protein